MAVQPTSAQITLPTNVAVDALGRLYISELNPNTERGRVRRVSNGIISTVAGNGTSDFSFNGDGGPAVGASMSPAGLAIGPNGQVYEADMLASRVRVLTPVPIPGVSFSATTTSVNTGAPLGQTTLSWSATGYSSLQIFANGSLFANVGSSGSMATGNWVGDGMNFSLVDPATGAPLSTVTVHTKAATAPTDQVTFAANPRTIALAGASVGKTTLSWNAPGHSALQIRVAGVLFAGSLPSSGSIDTGNWVSDGLAFSLVDPASGQTIAALTVAAK